MDQEDRFPSSTKKNSTGRVLSSGEKQMIINLYKSKMSEVPIPNYEDLMKVMSKCVGIKVKHIRSTISEYKKQKYLALLNSKRNRQGICDDVNDFDKNSIRRKVHQFWFNKKIPTISQVLMAVNKDDSLPNFKRETICKILKSLSFKFRNINGNSILTERSKIITWRRNYLRSIKQFRDEKRPIYYLEETWLNIGDCSSKVWVDEINTSQRMPFLEDLSTGLSNPSNKRKRFIIFHIGSENGFVPGALLCFEPKNNTRDYHDEVNGKTFRDWFEKVLPLLEKNAVIVMDNAPYHSVKCEKVPTFAWKKQAINDWLISKDEDVNPSEMVKVDLMNIVQRLKPSYNMYIIDEIAKKDDKTVLRLPPYHFDLNPIDMVWSMVKGYVKDSNTTFKPKDIKHLLYKSFDRVKKEDWISFIDHIKKEEDKYWNLDFIFDDLIENLEPNLLTIENSSSELSDDDDDDANFF